MSSVREIHCHRSELTKDIEYLESRHVKVTMQIDNGEIKIRYIEQGVRVERTYHATQAEASQSLWESTRQPSQQPTQLPSGQEQGLTADLMARQNVLQRLKEEIAAESVACQAEGEEISRLKGSHEKTRRRNALHVRNAAVGARGNELGRQRRLLLQDIATFQRQNDTPGNRAPGTAPQGPRISSDCPPPRPTTSSMQAPRPSWPAVTGFNSRPMQNQNPQGRPTPYHQQNPMRLPQPLPPPPQNAYMQQQYPTQMGPGSNPNPNPVYQTQPPFPPPQDTSFMPQHTNNTPNGFTSAYPFVYPPSTLSYNQISSAPPGPIRERDSYRPNVPGGGDGDFYRPNVPGGEDGDFYRPRYDGARQPSQLSAENHIPPYVLHPHEGQPQANGQLQGHALPASNLGRRRSSQVYEPSFANVAVPRFGAPTPQAPRVNPQTLQPIQNILRGREQEQLRAKRKADDSDMDQTRVKRSMISREQILPLRPKQAYTYEDLPLYDASPPRYGHGGY